MDRVLFVSPGGNRAVMAATILREHAAHWFEAWAGALKPQAIDSRTVAVLREHDLDEDGLWVRPLEQIEGGYRYVIALDATVELPNWLGTESLLWPMPDPVAADSLAAFERTRDLLEMAVFDWLNKFEERFEPEEPNVPPHHLEGRAQAVDRPGLH